MSYHLVKSNPDVYKLREAIDYYRSVDDVSWTICKNAKPDDILFIGQSGEKAGIYAKAIVAGNPTFEKLDDDFFINLKGASKLAWVAHIKGLTPMKSPILEHHLKAFPALKGVAQWLHCQVKARYLSDEEGEALLRFI